MELQRHGAAFEAARSEGGGVEGGGFCPDSQPAPETSGQGRPVEPEGRMLLSRARA